LKYFSIVFLLFLLAIINSCKISVSPKINIRVPKIDVTTDYQHHLRLALNINEVNDYIFRHRNYNDEIGFFIDMKIPSGKNRFFVYSFKAKKVVDRGLVAHGSGSETGIKDSLKFSNELNSLCTSVGKYYIGKSYFGQFGKAYKLYGLDSTNSKAFERTIVLHYHEKVPHKEQNFPICNSFGCPMVNEEFFRRLEKHIGHSGKNMILSVFY